MAKAEFMFIALKYVYITEILAYNRFNLWVHTDFFYGEYTIGVHGNVQPKITIFFINHLLIEGYFNTFLTIGNSLKYKALDKP